MGMTFLSLCRRNASCSSRTTRSVQVSKMQGKGTLCWCQASLSALGAHREELHGVLPAECIPLCS